MPHQTSDINKNTGIARNAGISLAGCTSVKLKYNSITAPASCQDHIWLTGIEAGNSPACSSGKPATR